MRNPESVRIVYGPYKHGNRYRLSIRFGRGRGRKSTTQSYATREQAAAAAHKERGLAIDDAMAIGLSDVEIPPRCETGGYVYFAQTAGRDRPTKIGFTKDLAERMKVLTVANPKEVKLVGFFVSSNPKQDEADLHERFADLRIRGEWFRCELSLAEYIGGLMESHDDVAPSDED